MGQIICLNGPLGVGKTSICENIAKTLGGVLDEPEI